MVKKTFSAPKPAEKSKPASQPKSTKSGPTAGAAGAARTSKPAKPKPAAPMLEALKSPTTPKPAAAHKPSKASTSKPAAAKASSSKTAAATKTASTQALTTKTRKPRPKPKESTPIPTATRPTMSDGKVDREIWQPSDGNGDPSPELIEKYRSKRNGHPTWKLYTGRNVPKNPTDTNPPCFVVLDDKAAWTILNSKNWTKHERHRKWPFDFTPQGRISLQRPNRGRPAYGRDGTTYASVPKQKGEKYWLHGCHEPPKADGRISPAPTAAGAPGDNQIAATPPSSAHLAPLMTAGGSPMGEQSPLELPPSTELATVEPNVTPVSASTTTPTPAPPPACITPPTTESSSRTSSSPRPSAVGSPTQRPRAIVSPSPGPSVQAIKRSASPDHPAATPPKRQRKSLVPLEVPPDLANRDSQVTQLQKALQVVVKRESETANEKARLEATVAVQQKTIAESRGRLEASERKAKAFRDLAMKLYARSVDHSNVLVDRHTAMLGILQDVESLKATAERLAVGTRREIAPTEALQGEIGAVLDQAEQGMRAQGLGEEYEVFVDEAMNLDIEE
ncbi:hypothetical protein SLS57_004467 [Botryosphaeria dothidea]